MSTREELSAVKERLAKVVYVEPPVDRGGRNLDGLTVLLEDARWLAGKLEEALNHIYRLTTPEEVA